MKSQTRDFGDRLDELVYISAKNLERRQLTDIQKFEVSKKLKPAIESAMKDRQVRKPVSGTNSVTAELREQTTTSKELSKAVGLSKRKLQRKGL